jgi:RHS repeat-associated protein
MTVEIYAYGGYAYGDTLGVYYDDFSIDDFAAISATTYSYDHRTGQVLSCTDPLGRRTNCSYDVLGRVIWTQYADGSHTRTVYDDQNYIVTHYDELNRMTKAYYDSIGRFVKAERYVIPGTPFNYSYVYCKYNWQDKALTYRNELGYVTSYDYDYLGRQTKVTNPGGTSFRTTTYDDLNSIVTATDELGHKTAQVCDNLGRLNSTWEYFSAGAHYWTNMTYDAAGNLLSVRDANGKFTNMTYDQLNRLTKTTYPDTLFDSATYDSAGRVMTKTDRKGTVTSSTYDSAGDLVKMSNSADTVRYSYDAAGQRTKAVSNLGSMTYGFNKRGWTTSLVETIGSDSFTTRLGYDAAGNGIWTLYPDNLNVSIAYDAFNRLTYVNKTAPISKQLLKVTYNVDNTIATETFGQSQITTYTYDQAFKRGWVHSMITKNGTNTVLSLTYTYDAAGNIKYLNSNSGGNESYTYDALNRLTRAWTNTTKSFGKITYGYDAVGNRLWSLAGTTNTTYTYAGYNQLNKTVAGTTTWFYNYDKDGNQIWKNRSASTRYNYQFNSLNELTQSVKWTYNSQKKTWSSSTVGQYSYDANGMRAKTVEGSYTTEYVYVGHNPLCEKNGTAYTDYIYANGGLKVKLVGGSTYFCFDDALGSPWVVWQSGKTSATFSVKTYKPFGTPIVSTGTEKFGYAGEIRDSAAGTSPGLYYIGARWMDPELGRFVSMDPRLGSLSAPQTIDRYVYCVNNPLRFTDPTGEWFGIKLPKISLQTIILVAVCVAVTVGTGGLGGGIAGAILIGALTGAATNAGMYTAFTALEGGKLTFQGFASAAVSGAISGAVGAISGGVGSGFIKIGGSIGTQIAGSTIARLGAAAGIGALGGVASYIAGEGTKMAMTGGKEGSITGRGLLLGAAFGSAGGFSAGALSNYGLKPGFPDYAAMPSYSEAVKQAAPSILYTGMTGFLRKWAANGDIGLAVRVSTIPSFQG